MKPSVLVFLLTWFALATIVFLQKTEAPVCACCAKDE